jgi:uncharacterized protein HemX
VSEQMMEAIGIAALLMALACAAGMAGALRVRLERERRRTRTLRRQVDHLARLAREGGGA